MSARALRGLGCAVLVAAGLTSFSTGRASAEGVNVLQFTFDGTVGSQITTVTNTGTASVSSAVLHRKATSPNVDDQATTVQGATTAAGVHVSGTAMDLPRYQPLASGPALSIVRVENPASVTTAAKDPLNPGTGAFTWRADFALDSSLAPAQSGDGDNVFQRGVNPDPQWKLSADLGAIQCVIRDGSGHQWETGTVQVKPTTGQWYRGTCTRSAAGVLSLVVVRFDAAQGKYVAFATATPATGATANLGAINPQTPVSIGGKLISSGIYTDHPDQFNGVIDSAVLTIG